MKAAQVRGFTPDQLGDELIKLKKEQFNLRFQAASGQLENTARVRQIRRDIARIKTIAGQAPQAEGAVKIKAAPEPKASPGAAVSIGAAPDPRRSRRAARPMARANAKPAT